MEFSQLRVGMLVRVGERVPRHHQGWSTLWVDGMDRAVGHVYQIEFIDPMFNGSSLGVQLRNHDDHRNSPPAPDAYFPWHNLTHIPSEVPDLLDSSLHGPNQYDRREMRFSWHFRSPFNGESVVRDQSDTTVALQAQRRERFAKWKMRKVRARERLNARLLSATQPKVWRYQLLVTAPSRMGQLRDTKTTVRNYLTALKGHPREHPSPEATARFLEECQNTFTSDTVRHGIFKAMKLACPDLGVTWCDKCGVFHAIPEEHSVIDGRRICPSCVSENYRWSELEGRPIDRDIAARVYRTVEEWCERSSNPNPTPSYVSRGYAESCLVRHPESAWEFFTSEVFAEIFRNGRELSGELDGYHGAARDFTEVVTAGDPFPALGIELEVEVELPDGSEDNSDSSRDTRLNQQARSKAVLAVRKLDDPHICERDGSLSQSRGFEVVTKPYGKREWPGVAERLLATLRQHKAKGYDTTAEDDDGRPLRYGIHVNIHRRHLSPLQEARLLMFMAAEDNADFVRAIAQRHGLYGDPEVNMGNMPKRNLKVRRFGGIVNIETYNRAKGDYERQRKVLGLGKYSAINLKDSVAEFRIFQSTTYLPSFMKNLEFVWALVEWTSTKACTGKSWHHRDFVQWLVKRGGAKTDFPHLWEYLRRESYTIKRGPKRIENTWLDLLPRDGVGELDEAASEAQASAVVIPMRRSIAKAVKRAEEKLGLFALSA